MKRMLKKLVFALVMVGLTLVLLEAGLHVGFFVSPTVRDLLDPDSSITVSDDVLHHRPSPRFPDHDERGFRNELARERVDVVALGDSLTYGAMVVRQHAWPQQFEALSGLSTYNMGFGGYGPAHGLVLMDEALTLNPKLIVYGMYAGNDLFDCFALVYQQGSLSELRSKDEAVLRLIDQEEQARDIAEASRAHQRWTPQGIKEPLKKYSRLYGLARAVRNLRRGSIWQFESPPWQQVKASPLKHGEQLFETPQAQTVFTIQKRIFALDLEDIRIQEGLRIALASVDRMQRKAAENGVKFVVALFPTKEYAFQCLGADQGLAGPKEDYERLVAFEQRMWRQAKAALDAGGIDYYDTLPLLEKLLTDGNQPYRWDSDGHFDADGSRAVAEQILAFLKERKLLAFDASADASR